METTSPQEICIKLTGDNISPENVCAREIAKFIIFLVDAIEPLSQSVPKEDNLHVTKITPGSITFHFSTKHPDIIKAYTKITQAIVNNEYSNLPHKTINNLREIGKQSKKLGYTTEFISGLETTKSAKITPTTQIETTPIYIEGETTIYGYLDSAGGKNRPHVWIEQSDGKRISCEVRDKEQIRKLGSLLYTEVGLVGMAKWSVPDMEIETFQIKEILDYRETSLSDTIISLSHIAGDAFDNLDVEEWITQIRKE